MSIPKKILENLGLSDKETKVYLTCLELGPSPVQKIAQKAGINRTTAYTNLEDLSRLGLVSTTQKGKKTFFSAESPEALTLLVSAKEQQLKSDKEELLNVMPALFKIFEHSGDRPIVRFLEGKAGLETIEEDFIRVARSGDAIYGFVSHDDLFRLFPKYDSIYANRRVKKNIKLKTLYTNSNGPVSNANSKKDLRSAVYIEKKLLPNKTTLHVYGNRTAITTMSGKLVGVIIENEEMSDTIRNILKILFDTLEKRQ